MKKFLEIIDIVGREIMDSRGNPTVEVEVYVEDGVNTYCGRTLHEWKPVLELYRTCGGEIVTIGSDAHTASRVGQYSDRACALLKDIFGHVCTFENRQPIFHKL